MCISRRQNYSDYIKSNAWVSRKSLPSGSIKSVRFTIDIHLSRVGAIRFGGLIFRSFARSRLRTFELPVCSRCRQPGVETAGEPATADRSNVLFSEVSRSIHRLHDDSAETNCPAPACLDFRWRPGFQQFLTLLIVPSIAGADQTFHGKQNRPCLLIWLRSSP
jgi:hypothetical protein